MNSSEPTDKLSLALKVVLALYIPIIIQIAMYPNPISFICNEKPSCISKWEQRLICTNYVCFLLYD